MKIYPFTSPIILNDEIFTEFGGKPLESTPQLRNACYLIAEQQASSYLDTLLLPTNITGSADYNYSDSQILSTEYGYVQELLWLRVLDTQGSEVYRLDDSSSFGVIREDTYGYIYVANIHQYFGLCGSASMPFKFEFAYRAGLPTGTANQPGILLALTTAAQLVLNEMQTIPYNESTGDVGVAEFSSLQYHEKRKMWKNTVFGSSPKSSWIAHILDGTIKKARKSIMLGKL